MIEQGLLHRSSRHGEQRIIYDVKRDHFLDIARIACHDIPCKVCIFSLLVLIGNRIFIPQSDHFFKRRLTHDLGIHCDRVILRQIILIDKVERLRHIHIAVEVNIAVGRMIVSRVESEELLICKVGDTFGISAGFHAVGGIREKSIENDPLQIFVRRRESALHLIVDNAVVRDRIVFILNMIMPSFLAENIRLVIDMRMEDSIQIDIHQVAEIRVIGARDRIHGLVRVCHRIQECVERTLDELDERVFQREFFGTAQHGMFVDVGHAGRVLGRGAERDVEHLIVIVRRNQHDSRTGLFVPEDPSLSMNVRQILMQDYFISSQFFNIFYVHETSQ